MVVAGATSSRVTDDESDWLIVATNTYIQANGLSQYYNYVHQINA